MLLSGKLWHPLAANAVQCGNFSERRAKTSHVFEFLDDERYDNKIDEAKLVFR